MCNYGQHRALFTTRGLIEGYLFTGIVNRGDSFRRRRSRSNSLIPTPTTPEPQGNTTFTSDDGLLMPANVSRANSRNNSRRNSRASPNQTPNQSPRPSIAPQPPSPTGPTSHYRVAMIGARGVGRSALISQFLTSDSINAYEGPDGKCWVEWHCGELQTNINQNAMKLVFNLPQEESQLNNWHGISALINTHLQAIALCIIW